MTISPEEAKRLANELLDDDDPVKPAGQSAKGPIGVGSQIGRYRIESLIATGGMGAVYRANHEQPTRVVALKVVRPELLSSSAVRRFRHETELLGRLQHPGIAQIFEADSVRTDLGDQPYFAMEFVEGEPLLDHADEADLGTRDRLELFLKVCDAVEHAHRKGVIHRDLKPGNVLVTKEGQPKVLDFGVAKATDADIQSTTLRTDVGQLVGTLPYMSPEQAGGDAADLDTRSDVYSLGVLLYHLLSGQLPYEVKKGAVPEALRAIQEENPAPLSSIDKTLRGDVETIVGKALEKDRDRRYQGASDLAGDIRRYLANEAITARPASAWYQISKFSKRNRGIVIAGGLLAASLLLGIAGTTSGMLWAFGQKDRAESAEQATKHELTRVMEVKRLVIEIIRGVSPRESPGMDTSILKQILGNTSKRLMDNEIKDELIAAELHSIVGEVYLLLGLYEDSERHLPVALEIHNRLKGSEHQDTLDSMRKLGDLKNSQGKYEDAESLILDASEQAERLLNEEHVIRIALMNSLANSYRAQAKYAEAEPLLLKAMEINKRSQGVDHLNTLHSMTSLANVYRRQGRFAKAEPLCIRTLQLSKTSLGEEHPSTLGAANTLASLYFEQGRYKEAEGLWLMVLDVCERVLGAEHPSTLLYMNNVVLLYKAQGKYDLAIALNDKVLENQKQVLGEDHANTLGTANSSASLHYLQGRYKEAESIWLKTVELCAQALGVEHPTTLQYTSNLALVLRAQGRYDESILVIEGTIEIQNRTLGEEHPDSLTSANTLARLYSATSRHADAERLFANLLDIRVRVLGKEHPRTLESLNNLAAAYYNQGDFASAEPLFAETLQVRRRVLGLEHPQTLSAMTNLASLYVDQERFSAAEPIFLESLSVQTRELGEEHPSTLSTMGSLATLYAATDRRDDAEVLFLKSIEIRKRLHGGEHPETVIDIVDLSVLYIEARRFENARKLLEPTLPIVRRVLGAQHLSTKLALEQLAKAYSGLDRHTQAYPLYREILQSLIVSADAPGASESSLREAVLALLNHDNKQLRDADRALLLAKRACARAEESGSIDFWKYLDTLALAEFRSGDATKAIETQTRAISLMPEDTDEALLVEYTSKLAAYQASLP